MSSDMLTSAKSTLTPWHPTADQPWNMQRVIHLHRRAGFGANWPEIQRDLQSGSEAAIDRALRPVADRTAEEFEQLSAVIGSAAVAAN
ncbi:MAG: hypothetical protein KDA72_11060, partial [Planctomycetales bacterium]|nr:hypothetical protein [Planctomycetales bacterium]